MRILHRINYLDDHISSEVFPTADGIEFDIRDSAGEIIVQHDPFKSGQPFKEFVRYCPPSKFYIVNVKSEGIETDAVRILEEAGCRDFFLLDCSIPSIVRLGRTGERRLAARFSEFESIETVERLAPFISWVWIDVFTCLPISRDLIDRVHRMGLRTCLVSPELQAQPDKISKYVSFLLSESAIPTAVCTKQAYITHWNPVYEPSLYPTPLSHRSA